MVQEGETTHTSRHPDSRGWRYVQRPAFLSAVRRAIVTHTCRAFSYCRPTPGESGRSEWLPVGRYCHSCARMADRYHRAATGARSGACRNVVGKRNPSGHPGDDDLQAVTAESRESSYQNSSSAVAPMQTGRCPAAVAAVQNDPPTTDAIEISRTRSSLPAPQKRMAIGVSGRHALSLSGCQGRCTSVFRKSSSI